MKLLAYDGSIVQIQSHVATVHLIASVCIFHLAVASHIYSAVFIFYGVAVECKLLALRNLYAYGYKIAVGRVIRYYIIATYRCRIAALQGYACSVRKAAACSILIDVVVMYVGMQRITAHNACCR